MTKLFFPRNCNYCPTGMIFDALASKCKECLSKELQAMKDKKRREDFWRAHNVVKT